MRERRGRRTDGRRADDRRADDRRAGSDDRRDEPHRCCLAHDAQGNNAALIVGRPNGEDVSWPRAEGRTCAQGAGEQSA
jgi:hypothetical protein